MHDFTYCLVVYTIIELLVVCVSGKIMQRQYIWRHIGISQYMNPRVLEEEHVLTSEIYISLGCTGITPDLWKFCKLIVMFTKWKCTWSYHFGLPIKYKSEIIVSWKGFFWNGTSACSKCHHKVSQTIMVASMCLSSLHSLISFMITEAVLYAAFWKWK